MSMLKTLRRFFAIALVRTVPVGGAVACVLYATPNSPAVAFAHLSRVQSRITAPDGSVTLPLDNRAGTLYVDAVVNGKSARFIVDTGASVTVITPQAAQRFGMPLDASRGTLTGAVRVEARRGMVERLSVGVPGSEAVLEKETAVVAPVPEELRCDGLLGGTFLSRFVVTFDYLNNRITLTDPARFKKPAVAGIPLTFSRGIPAVTGRMGELEGIFRIDTGANDSLTLFKPWVEKNKLRTRYTRRIKTVTGQGLGGLLYGELVRLPSLTLGDVSIKNVIGEFSTNDNTSAFYDETVAGNIGASIWRRFTLTLDYPNQRVYLTKNADFDVPFITNRSGISASFQNGLMKVVDVVEGSPAQEAGIHQGDTIIALGGVLLNQMEPDAARMKLRGEPGTIVEMQVRTGDGDPRSIRLTLRDLL